ncbi:hypothetical protein LEP1GSC081_3017 [Leptospira kirschneri str. H1]|uniref:Uncharacterized protein n=1 Tax=Leptospira kirschneri str. H1 TaxID=1049966 RepID=A0A0E2AZ79_9LEPT|nr:hypothetical protein LEP1GSC081_3017 [Leptospira kirschneri str. H1]
MKRTGPTIFLFHKKILSSNSERKNSMLTVKLRRLLNSIDFFVDSYELGLSKNFLKV